MNDTNINDRVVLHFEQEGFQTKVEFLMSCYLGTIGKIPRRDYGTAPLSPISSSAS